MHKLKMFGTKFTVSKTVLLTAIQQAKIEKAKELVEVYSLEWVLDQINAILEDEKYLQLFDKVAYSLMDIKGYAEIETAEQWLLSAKASSPVINEACHSLF